MRTPLRTCLLWGVLAAVLGGLPVPVSAKKGGAAARTDGPTRPNAEAKAAQLLSQAQAELEALNLSAAYNSILASMKASPSVEALYILCRIAAAESKGIAARDLCRRYIADPAHVEQVTMPHQAEITAILGKQIPPAGEVAVFGGVGALLYVDDRLVGALPLSRPLLISPGQHRIALQENDHRQEWPVKVLDNRTVEMRFEPESSAVLVTQLPAVLLILRGAKMPAALQSRVQLAIEQAVQSAHFATLHESELAVGKDGDLEKCLRQPACANDLASRNNADYVLTVDISEYREEKSTKINAQIDFTFSESRVLAQSIRNDEVCNKCTATQLIGMASDSVRNLLSMWTGRSRGDLSISVNPKTAEILLDRVSVGAGRFEGAVRSGVYQIQARQPGYLSQRSSVAIEPGKSALVTLTLVPKVANYRKERSPRPRWRIIAGAVTAGIGLGLLTYGLSGVAIDGSCAETGPSGACRQVYGSRGTGIGFAVSGGLVAAAGAAMIAIPGAYQDIETSAGGFRDPTNE